MSQISGSASGENVNITASHHVGNPNANAGLGVFAASNTKGGPASTGAFASANANGHELSVSHTTTPGFGKTLAGNAKINVFDDKTHKVDVNAFHNHNKLENNFKVDKVGGSVDYSHINGHGASVGVSHIPQVRATNIDFAAKANQWQSKDMRTTFNFTAAASRPISGPFDKKTNFGLNAGLTHRF